MPYRVDGSCPVSLSPGESLTEALSPLKQPSHRSDLKVREKWFRNASKTFLKRLGVSNGFPVFYLNTEA